MKMFNTICRWCTGETLEIPQEISDQQNSADSNEDPEMSTMIMLKESLHDVGGGSESQDEDCFEDEKMTSLTTMVINGKKSPPSSTKKSKDSGGSKCKKLSKRSKSNDRTNHAR